MFCDDEVSAISVATAIECETCPATTAGSFRICASCSVLLGQCEVCRTPVDTSFLSTDARALIVSAQSTFESAITFATRTFELGIAPFHADYDAREEAVEEYHTFLYSLNLSKANSPDGADEAGDKRLQELYDKLVAVETSFEELHQPLFGKLYQTRNEMIQQALGRRDDSVRRVLALASLSEPRGPELPPSIRAHPEQGREALNLLDLAVAALTEFEKTVEYGFFAVHFTDEERAFDLAKHARTLIETATATPKTDLWLSDAFDSNGREYIDLPAFFTQNRRGKRFFKKVLKQFKRKLNDLRSFCLRELAAADANSEQKLLRQVVTELDPFGL